MKRFLAMNQITFVIIVKNGMKTLQKTLEPLRTWPHVLICDTGSHDGTLEFLKNQSHFDIQQIPFCGFGPTRNHASKFAKTPWVFHLDADEVPTPKLLEELKTKLLDHSFAYSVERDNYFWNRHMKGCSGWHPDFVVRLFHKEKFSYSNDLVHEKVIVPAQNTLKLKNSLIHTPYQNLHQMALKMNHYSDLFASNTQKKVTVLSPFLHGVFAFLKSYILKKGFTQGFQGFVLSKYIADTAFYKYLKLYEKQKKL